MVFSCHSAEDGEEVDASQEQSDSNPLRGRKRFFQSVPCSLTDHGPEESRLRGSPGSQLYSARAKRSNSRLSDIKVENIINIYFSIVSQKYDSHCMPVEWAEASLYEVKVCNAIRRGVEFKGTVSVYEEENPIAFVEILAEQPGSIPRAASGHQCSHLDFNS